VCVCVCVCVCTVGAMIEDLRCSDLCCVPLELRKKYVDESIVCIVALIGLRVSCEMSNAIK